MASDQKTKSLEERVADLEAQNEEFRRRLGLPGTDVTDLLNAIDLIIECQDTSALDDFLNRGGKIPVARHCDAYPSGQTSIGRRGNLKREANYGRKSQ